VAPNIWATAPIIFLINRLAMNQSICYLQHLLSHQPRHTLLNVILQIAIQIFSFNLF